MQLLVLTTTHKSDWLRHNRGGIQLIELRGPENFKSKFAWILFKCQAPLIVSYYFFLTLSHLRISIEEKG